MKKLFVAMMVAVSAMTITVVDAEAKRLGSGSSIGKQSQGVSRQAPAQSTQNQASSATQAAPATAGAAAAARPPSPWKNILGGALLGLGLGALLSQLGIGGALANVIGTVLMVGLLALAAMFIYRMFRRKNGGDRAEPAFAGGYGAARTPDIGSRLDQSQPSQPSHAQPAAFQADTTTSAGAAHTAALSVPAGFDTPGFLRHAKTYFIRLQAAWDRADVNDIREFTTPEMFAELKMQLQERGASANHTDVVSLDADLLGVETVNDEHIASVRFSGMIRESENAPAAPFAEAWNLSKPAAGAGGWVLAGIQQLS